MTKKRILYVEDNPQNKRLVNKVLTAKGYQVLEAEDGLQGVDMALTERPDLILMDLAGGGLLGEPRHDVGGYPATEDQPRADGFQVGGE